MDSLASSSTWNINKAAFAGFSCSIMSFYPVVHHFNKGCQDAGTQLLLNASWLPVSCHD